MLQQYAPILPYIYNLSVTPTERGLKRNSNRMIALMVRDFRRLARTNHSHLQPIAAYDVYNTENPHYHAIIMADKPLKFDCLKFYHTGVTSILAKPFEQMDNSIKYVVAKNGYYTHIEHSFSLFHPRNHCCKNNVCDIAIKTKTFT